MTPSSLVGLRTESSPFEMNNTVRKFGWWILVSGLLVVSAGYVSNFVSARGCEWRTAQWLAAGFEDSAQIVCVGWPEGVDPKALFRTNLVVSVSRSGNATAPPWEALPRDEEAPVLLVGKASCRIPFLTVVGWDWSTAPTTGAFGSAWYLCLFGWPVRLACVTSGSY